MLHSNARTQVVSILVLMDYVLLEPVCTSPGWGVQVSILVLMDYVLLVSVVHSSKENDGVSILVLMDYVLLGTVKKQIAYYWLSLNPCFNGLCSSGRFVTASLLKTVKVSILVLMDYVLLEQSMSVLKTALLVSILVLMDYVLLARFRSSKS